MPSQNVLLVTWTWPSIRIRPLRREGLQRPCSSESAAAAGETSEVPAAARAPAPRPRSARRRVIFESLIRMPLFESKVPNRIFCAAPIFQVKPWRASGGALDRSGSGWLGKDRLHLAFAHRAFERIVVFLVLVGVGRGEARDGEIERVALSQIPGDQRRGAGAGVRKRQRLP